jgi:hypothetical protein
VPACVFFARVVAEVSDSADAASSLSALDEPPRSKTTEEAGRRPRRVYQSYHVDSRGFVRKCGVTLPPVVLMGTFLPPPAAALLLHVPFPREALLTAIVTGVHVGVGMPSASLAHYGGILRSLVSFLRRHLLPQLPSAHAITTTTYKNNNNQPPLPSTRSASQELPDPNLPRAKLTLDFAWNATDTAFELTTRAVNLTKALIPSIVPAAVLGAVASAIKVSGDIVAYCTSTVIRFLWPDHFRVSYAYLPWHLPVDLAIALLIILVGLEAAKAFALIVQV